jgi:hypothetical protein
LTSSSEKVPEQAQHAVDLLPAVAQDVKGLIEVSASVGSGE